MKILRLAVKEFVGFGFCAMVERDVIAGRRIENGIEYVTSKVWEQIYKRDLCGECFVLTYPVDVWIACKTFDEAKRLCLGFKKQEQEREDVYETKVYIIEDEDNE